ncbi:MAG: diguanylate cyclase [Magnetococcales bacterium]|nr:diguanylate cyclase [Magnetococcales bacterium]
MTEEKKRLKLKSSGDAKAVSTAPERKWRVLVVDDDVEVHAVTRMILGKLRFKGRGIEILDAFSAAEAKELLERERTIAVILLDVVMETEDAGLQLVRMIRDKLGNRAVRIILRTGQPGQAPEEQVIMDYDINDYKAKSELTAQKLFTSVIAALRSWETIVSLERTEAGLTRILDSTGTLFQVSSLQQFASGVLTRLAIFLECQPSGIMCVQFDTPVPGVDAAPCSLRVLASTGVCASCVGCALQPEVCQHQVMVDLIKKGLTERCNQYVDGYTVLFIDADGVLGAAVLMHGERCARVDEQDRKLLALFASKVSLGLANTLHYQKMITAEAAASTDFLTGLNNRRQLLRLGVSLVANAWRSGSPLAVAMLDIDHFKRINDTWGHDAGDEVLKRVAEKLATRFRRSDVVARMGGEEFCVIATNLTTGAAYELFNGFCQTLAAEPVSLGGQEVRITISIGVTTRVADHIDTMITAADALLYRAKQEGRNRVVIE